MPGRSLLRITEDEMARMEASQNSRVIGAPCGTGLSLDGLVRHNKGWSKGFTKSMMAEEGGRSWCCFA